MRALALAVAALALAGCSPFVIVVREVPARAAPPPPAGPNPCDVQNCTPRPQTQRIA